MIRVAVADDSSFIRRALARILSEENGIQLVGAAGSGEELLDHLDRWRPDAIILDLSMPGMGGLPTLDRIMTTWPTPVIILSTHSKRDAPQTIEALHRGAMDFVDKQEYSLVDFDALRGVLLEKLRQVTGMEGDEPDEEPSPRGPYPELGRAVGTLAIPGATAGLAGEIQVVVIGASTGGPPAIERILKDLGASITVPVAVVQHMPAGFTRAFAERLNAYLPLQVREAMDREPLLPGTVYIAPGGMHLTIVWDGSGLKSVLATEPAATHRPSVDVLFNSAAAAVGRRAAAVLLTGMGHDGARGMAELARAGARTFAQDEATSVIYGMPKAAVLAGAVGESLPLGVIGGRLQEVLGGRG
ncbi:MAG: two-component system, chemotaxis family, protein-glutamate methylesterase/glutaminase [Acidobacteriota bacterium]|nr:two-component system, chemotaxis family, protein-glutamate methylesterase/glutaminase [Acidobacteriota bacterium]